MKLPVSECITELFSKIIDQKSYFYLTTNNKKQNLFVPVKFAYFEIYPFLIVIG